MDKTNKLLNKRSTMQYQTLIYFANIFERKLFDSYQYMPTIINITPTFCRISGYNLYTIGNLRTLLPKSIIKSKHYQNGRTVYSTH